MADDGYINTIKGFLKFKRPHTMAAEANSKQEGMSASQKRRVKEFKEGFSGYKEKPKSKNKKGY